MKIERLELYGCNRLLLNNIKHFVYTPSTTYQLILGTNGSGKSSILAELSPLPAHSSNFSKDGFKKVTIHHQGRHYQLDSVFKTGKHHFVVDGEELNSGGTGESQKTLVYQHFGINKDIHELLTGETRLTQLSPSDRRKWITAISKADYGYVMGTYKRLAGKARDQQGALKHLKTRLAQETHNLQTLQDVDGLEERSLKLRDELNQLMLERVPNLPTLETHKDRMHTLCEEVIALSKDYFGRLTYMPAGKAYQSNDDVSFDLQRIDTNIHSTQALVERMGNEYSDMESVIAAVHVEAGASLDNLPELIEQQLETLQSLRASQQLFCELSHPSEMRRDWSGIADEVQMTFRALPNNVDRRYTRESIQKAQQDLSRHQGIVDTSMSKLASLQARVETMCEAKETKCPSCAYIWRDGYSEEEMAQLLVWQEDHAAAVDQARLVIKSLEAFIEECQGYAALYQRFRGFVQGYPRLQPLWDHILSHQLMLDNPKGQLGLFVQWAADLELNVQHEQGLKRLEHYRDVQERQQSMGDSAHFSRRMAVLQREIEEATARLYAQRCERQGVDSYCKKLTRLQDLAHRMENDCNEIERIRTVLLDALRNDIIDKTVSAHQLELGGIMRKLSEKEGQEGIVRDLESSKHAVELDANALRLLVQALSPNEGLIAEQLSSDIGCLVAQLNSVIQSIWTYDMSVLPCSLDSGELDYKFPVQFATADHRSPDVSKTSKGQRQVFDFAFQLTVMLYLNLTDYPLFLDEPGEGFDEQHRVKLMDFVKQLMDMNQHSQLFLISHYASSHGAFTSAEVLVLDASNISVPGAYNQHVVLA